MSFTAAVFGFLGLVCLLAPAEAVPTSRIENSDSSLYLQVYEAGKIDGQMGPKLQDGSTICPTMYPGGFTIICNGVSEGAKLVYLSYNDRYTAVEKHAPYSLTGDLNGAARPLMNVGEGGKLKCWTDTGASVEVQVVFKCGDESSALPVDEMESMPTNMPDPEPEANDDMSPPPTNTMTDSMGGDDMMGDSMDGDDMAPYPTTDTTVDSMGGDDMMSDSMGDSMGGDDMTVESTGGDDMTGEPTSGDDMTGESMGGDDMTGDSMSGEETMGGDDMTGEPMDGSETKPTTKPPTEEMSPVEMKPPMEEPQMEESAQPIPVPPSPPQGMKGNCVVLSGLRNIDRLAPGWVRLSNGIVYKPDQGGYKIERVPSSDSVVMRMRFTAPQDSRMAVAMDSTSRHGTEANDLFVRMTSPKLILVKGNEVESGSFMKAYQNSNGRDPRMRCRADVRLPGGKRHGDSITTGMLKKGETYEFHIAGRSNKFTLHHIVMWPCSGESCSDTSKMWQEMVKVCRPF